MANRRSPLRSLSIGGATYDLFLFFDTHVAGTDHALTFRAGEKTHIAKVIEACGGGAANTSVGLSRLGCEAHFCGVLGSDQWGEKMLGNLKKENVNADSATIVEGETSSFSVILSARQDRSILHAPGVGEHLHDVTFDHDAIMGADIVYLNHLCETSCVIEDDIVKKLESFPGHLTWNPGGCQVEKGMRAPEKAGLLAHTNLLLLNKEEALLFTNCITVEDALSALIDAGVEHVCITDGKNGVTAADKTNRYHCPILQTTIVDTTGAGDAFGTAATWALAHGKSLPEALIAGTLNASNVVGAIGSESALLTISEMEQKLTSPPLSVSTL